MREKKRITVDLPPIKHYETLFRKAIPNGKVEIVKRLSDGQLIVVNTYIDSRCSLSIGFEEVSDMEEAYDWFWSWVE